jgi:Flp pilus assembly protein TadG
VARRRRDDRGAVTASVAVLPAVLALFFAVVQISLWFYARSVATTAARHGLDAARVQNGTSGDGEAMVDQFLGQVGGFQVDSLDVSRGTEDATVTITGEAVSVVPFFEVPITVTLEGPVERTVE